MADEHFDQQPEETNPPLTFLRILLITSFIGSGMGCVSYFFCGVFFDSLGPVIDTSPFAMQRDVMLMLMAAGRWFFLVNAVFFGISFYGVFRMWKLYKVGFHFYSLSQIALLIVPFLFMHGYTEAIPQAMLTGIFIFSYASNLRFMK